MNKLLLSFSVVLCAGYVTGKSLGLPSYIPACSRNEPDLNACSLKNARLAVPKFIDGDRKYRIPVLDPMVITELRTDDGILGLKLTAKDLKFRGLRQSHIVSVVNDLKKQYTQYIIKVPRVEIEMEYDINGRILILPITGHGPGNLTMMNVDLDFSFNWDVIKKKDGDYFIITDSKLIFDTSRLYIKLENLFNGNKLLGDQMNVFMDEHWRDLVKDLGPVIGDAIGEAMASILNHIYELVTYDETFPDTPVGKT